MEKLNYDHSKGELKEAMLFTPEEISDMTSKFAKYSMTMLKGKEPLSKIAELVEKELSLKVLIYITTKYVFEETKGFAEKNPILGLLALFGNMPDKKDNKEVDEILDKIKKEAEEENQGTSEV